MGEWRQRQLADGRQRVGVFSSEIPSQIAAPVRRPSNSSERDVSFAYEGFECSGVTIAVTDVAARIEPAIRVARQKGRRKSGDKRSSRSRRAREISSDLSRAATARKKKKGGEKETWTKNSGVAPFSSGERRAREKKSIPMSPAPGGGARYMYRAEGADDSLYSDAQGRK